MEEGSMWNYLLGISILGRSIPTPHKISLLVFNGHTGSQDFSAVCSIYYRLSCVVYQGDLECVM